MVHLRATILACLTLVMTLTGVGAAIARGQMASEGVFCGEGGIAFVFASDGLPLFDPDGNPVEMAELRCLDCILGAEASAPGAAKPGRPLSAAKSLEPVSHLLPPGDLWRMGGKGRSPPRDV